MELHTASDTIYTSRVHKMQLWKLLYSEPNREKNHVFVKLWVETYVI